MSDKLSGLSMNLETTNIDKLKSVFPECFSEEKLDIDKLLSLCGEYIDNDFEKYKFEWKGKSESLRLAQRRSMGALRPCPEDSVNFDTTQNLYIEGDNLEVMKLLQTAYYRKVKMIYIDPPYNTGNDFVYEDDFADPIQRYKEVTQQTTKSNPETMGRYHTNWLNMMYPRLRLAANLLRDDGVIFVSIDDNEVHNLRKLCDEVFGEENYIGTIIWKNATDNNPTQIATEHEYIICYARNRQESEAVWKTKVSSVKDILLNIGEELCSKYTDDEMLQAAYTEWHRENKSQLWPLDRYKYIDRGGVYTGSQSVHNPGREGYRYDVIHPVTGKPCKQPLLGYRFPESTMQDLINSRKVLYGEDHNKIIELKVYASEYEEKLSSLFELDGRLGSYDLKGLFKGYSVFTNPKPVQLLKRILSFITTDNDLIFDFFSGSATIAQAVMEINKTDRNRRQFICVQLPENLDSALEYANQRAKADIKNAIKFLNSINKPHFISEIGKERIRRAGRKLTEKGEQMRFGEEDYSLDIGFRVFMLDTSNLKTWDTTVIDEDNLFSLYERMNDMIDTIKSDRNDMDIIYEIMLKMGVPLTASVTIVDIGGKKAYSVSDECHLLICLQEGLTAELIEQMADAHMPSKIILSEKCFADDTAMSNAHYILKERNIELKLV